MENVDIFYNHWEYFTAIWYDLFGTVCGHLVHFSRFGMIAPKNLATMTALINRPT
jgi:hypothetical protein